MQSNLHSIYNKTNQKELQREGIFSNGKLS